MAKEEQKDFNAMLNDSKDMPKFQTITDERSIEKYGGNRMYFAPPIDYDKIMRLGSTLQSQAVRILPNRSRLGSLYRLQRGQAISGPRIKRRIGEH